MDLDGYIRFLLALLFVLGLIGLLAWLVRKLGIGGKVVAAGTGGRSKGARLGVVEAATLDGRRKLVLIRRDDREHLVILGADGETVVERNIAPPVGEDAEPAEESAAETNDAPRADFRSILSVVGSGLAAAKADPAAREPEPDPEDTAPVAPSKSKSAAARRNARKAKRAAARKAS